MIRSLDARTRAEQALHQLRVVPMRRPQEAVEPSARAAFTSASDRAVFNCLRILAHGSVGQRSVSQQLRLGTTTEE